jgi:hypothetical protein
MRTLLFSVPFLIVVSAMACAQPAVAPVGNMVLSPPSVTPPPEARASDYLHAAQNALAARRYNEAQDALEMAQTRLLDRSVPLGQTHNPSDNPIVAQITQALQALAAQDRATCMQLIQTAIGSTTVQGF